MQVVTIIILQYSRPRESQLDRFTTLRTIEHCLRRLDYTSFSFQDIISCTEKKRWVGWFLFTFQPRCQGDRSQANRVVTFLNDWDVPTARKIDTPSLSNFPICKNWVEMNPLPFFWKYFVIMQVEWWLSSSGSSAATLGTRESSKKQRANQRWRNWVGNEILSRVTPERENLSLRLDRVSSR